MKLGWFSVYLTTILCCCSQLLFELREKYKLFQFTCVSMIQMPTMINLYYRFSNLCMLVLNQSRFLQEATCDNARAISSNFATPASTLPPVRKDLFSVKEVPRPLQTTSEVADTTWNVATRMLTSLHLREHLIYSENRQEIFLMICKRHITFLMIFLTCIIKGDF